MFGMLKKKSATGAVAQFKIDGMHCTSCSLNIDGELEDLPGVLDASTSYAKSLTKVTYDPEVIAPAKILTAIKQVGYEAQEIPA